MAVRLCVCIFLFRLLLLCVGRSLAASLVPFISRSLSVCPSLTPLPWSRCASHSMPAYLPSLSVGVRLACVCVYVRVYVCVCASVRCARYVSVCSLVPQMAALFLARFDFESCVQNVGAHHYASCAHPSIQCHKRGCAVEPSASASHQTLCLAARDYIYMCVCVVGMPPLFALLGRFGALLSFFLCFALAVLLSLVRCNINDCRGATAARPWSSTSSPTKRSRRAWRPRTNASQESEGLCKHKAALLRL